MCVPSGEMDLVTFIIVDTLFDKSGLFVFFIVLCEIYCQLDAV